MVIIGSWHVALSAIIAYKYGPEGIGMKPHINVLLVSGDTISGYTDMDTINKILQYMQREGQEGE